MEGAEWSSLLWGLSTLPTPPAPCLGWGAVGGSKALAGLTWRAHSAPSPIYPRCLAASAGPAPSPGLQSPADGLQRHRERVTPPLPQELEHTSGMQRKDQRKDPGDAASQAGFKANLCEQSPGSTQVMLPGALLAAPGEGGGHRKKSYVPVLTHQAVPWVRTAGGPRH